MAALILSKHSPQCPSPRSAAPYGGARRHAETLAYARVYAGGRGHGRGSWPGCHQRQADLRLLCFYSLLGFALCRPCVFFRRSSAGVPRAIKRAGWAGRPQRRAGLDNWQYKLLMGLGSRMSSTSKIRPRLSAMDSWSV